MSTDTVNGFISSYPYLFVPLAIVLAYLLFRLTRFLLARGFFKIAFRTETTYDDLLVDALYPFRVAWVVPLALLFLLARYAYPHLPLLEDLVLFSVVWILVDFAISLLTGINEIYRHNPRYTGTPVAGYIGLLKVVTFVIGIVITISMFTDMPPAVLLGGVGAWLAVLLLIFRDTILAFLASVQISTQELVKDGDWIEVPSYDANGIVADIGLNAIKVRNFDNTLTMIPTHKIVDVAFRNYRGIEESGARRLKLTINIDVDSIHFCDLNLLDKLSKYDLIADTVNEQIAKIKESQLDSLNSSDFPLDSPQLTNVQLFMRYADAYLGKRKDLHRRRLPHIIYISEPSSSGVSVNIFAYTRKTSWPDYAAIKDDITIHMIAAVPYFGLKVFRIAAR